MECGWSVGTSPGCECVGVSGVWVEDIGPHAVADGVRVNVIVDAEVVQIPIIVKVHLDQHPWKQEVLVAARVPENEVAGRKDSEERVDG